MLRFVLVAVVLALSIVGPAKADWRRAESQHFIVYSDGSERSLRDYTARLERFHGLLRVRLSTGEREEPRKLPVYLVSDARALRVAQPGLPEGIAGYYSASENDIFAVLVRGREDDILLHEYSHHFMAQQDDGGFPGWMREGFADYFATATVSERGKATFGLPNPGRTYALQNNRWMPMEQLLRARGSFDIEDRDARGMYYAQSWLLLHWLVADAERIARLGDYLQAINRGDDHVEAWQTHFGMTPEMLTTALRAYLRGRIYYAEGDLPPITPTMTVTVLSPAAEAVLLPMVNARNHHRPGIDGPALLTTFRAAVTRFPEDPLALVGLGMAEKQWGDEQAAEAALRAALDREPTNVEGLLLLAGVLTERAEVASDDATRLGLLREAQGLLARALAADDTDYRVFAALARLRRNAENYPTDNDLETWRMAVDRAPQVQSIRGDAALALMRAEHYNEAAAMLAPILNDPHGGPGSRRARELLQEIAERAGRVGDDASGSVD